MQSGFLIGFNFETQHTDNNFTQDICSSFHLKKKKNNNQTKKVLRFITFSLVTSIIFMDYIKFLRSKQKSQIPLLNFSLNT